MNYHFGKAMTIGGYSVPFNALDSIRIILNQGISNGVAERWTLTFFHQNAKVAEDGPNRIITRLPDPIGFRQLGMLSFKDSTCRWSSTSAISTIFPYFFFTSHTKSRNSQEDIFPQPCQLKMLKLWVACSRGCNTVTKFLVCSRRMTKSDNRVVLLQTNTSIITTLCSEHPLDPYRSCATGLWRRLL